MIPASDSVAHFVSKWKNAYKLTTLCFYTYNRWKGRTIKSCSKMKTHRQGFAYIWYLSGDLSVKCNKQNMSIFSSTTCEVKRLLTPLHPLMSFQRFSVCGNPDLFWEEHSSAIRKSKSMILSILNQCFLALKINIYPKIPLTVSHWKNITFLPILIFFHMFLLSLLTALHYMKKCEKRSQMKRNCSSRKRSKNTKKYFYFLKFPSH